MLVSLKSNIFTGLCTDGKVMSVMRKPDKPRGVSKVQRLCYRGLAFNYFSMRVQTNIWIKCRHYLCQFISFRNVEWWNFKQTLRKYFWSPKGEKVKTKHRYVKVQWRSFFDCTSTVLGVVSSWHFLWTMRGLESPALDFSPQFLVIRLTMFFEIHKHCSGIYIFLVHKAWKSVCALVSKRQSILQGKWPNAMADIHFVGRFDAGVIPSTAILIFFCPTYLRGDLFWRKKKTLASQIWMDILSWMNGGRAQSPISSRAMHVVKIRGFTGINPCEGALNLWGVGSQGHGYIDCSQNWPGWKKTWC